MTTFRDVIEAFGRTVDFSRAIGVKEPHGQTMKDRNSIPQAYWVEVVNAAKLRNIQWITFEALARIGKQRARR